MSLQLDQSLIVVKLARIFATTALFLGTISAADAQWTVVNLHFESAWGSGATSVDAGQQAGRADMSGTHPILWTGSASTWVDLLPTNATSGSVFGTSNGQQVGNVYMGMELASLWTGSAASWVNLNPPGAVRSVAMDCNGSAQVGGVSFGGLGHAGIWSGTAASWVSLHPSGASGSGARGMDDFQQVGTANVSGNAHASLWNGTAASWVDLHPVGATYSDAFAVHSGQQVGETFFGGVHVASLWRNTAASWVNLNPTSSTWSAASGVYGSEQVGSAKFGNYFHAGLWRGTAASWVDLHSFLPAYFYSSQASGITRSGGFTYIVGHGQNTMTNRYEALVWVRQDEFQPTSYNVHQGLNFGGNLGSLLNSDDNKVYVLCDEFDSVGEIQFNSTLPAGTVSQLKFKHEGSASRNDLSQFVRMFNYSTNAYTNVSIQNSTIVDSVVEGTITTGAASYVSGTREVKSRVFWVPQADISNVDGWTQTCDQAIWTVN